MKKSKRSNEKKEKGKLTQVTEPQITEIFEIPETPIVLIEPDIRQITIELLSFENILTNFASANIKAEIKFLDNVLGQTNLLPILDDMQISVNQLFQFECDVNCNADLDKLISNPIILTITQHLNTISEVIEVPKDRQLSKGSLDSALSIYEAIAVENRLDIVEVKRKLSKSKPSKVKKKDGKGSKGRKSSKTSVSQKSGSSLTKGRKSSVKSSPSKNLEESLVYGICILDLLPLIFGNQSFHERLPIKPIYEYFDDRLRTYKLFPTVLIRVSICKAIQFPKIPDILSVTLESVYNLPSIMQPNMNYRISLRMPNENTLAPMLFSNPNVWYRKDGEYPRVENVNWPGTQFETNYKVKDALNEIKNVHNINLPDSTDVLESCLMFNYIKRNYYLCDGKMFFTKHLTDFRNVVVEFFMEENEERRIDASVSEVSVKKRKSKKKEKDEGETEGRKSYLHLMAIVDLSDLLYPGVKRTRVAAQFRTFQYTEAFVVGGLEDSFFLPRPKVEKTEGVVKIEKTGKRGSKKGSEKSSKKSKSKKSSEKSSKKSAGKKKGGKGDMKNLLPPKPAVIPPEEPSLEVFDENGQPCFIVIEIELTTPLKEPRPLAEINEEYEEFVDREKPSTLKLPLTPDLSKTIYEETVKRIIEHMYNEHSKYLKMKEICYCKDQIDFIKYLRKIGVYQKYLFSLTKSVNTLVTQKQAEYNVMDRLSHKGPSQDHLICEIYTYLMENVNSVLNKIVGDEILVNSSGKLTEKRRFTLYARQAAALKRYSDAERYYLQVITDESEADDADKWLNFAIFKLQMKQPEESFHCIAKVLKIRPECKIGLLMHICLLFNLNKIHDAEVCLNKLLSVAPNWAVGWFISSLFFEKLDNEIERKHSLIMAEKSFENHGCSELEDYCKESLQDLTWTVHILPKTLHFHAASLLLKLKLYNWSEMILAHALSSNYALANYLMSAICYEKEMYMHALEHINETKNSYGSDYAVASLSGHCYLSLNRIEEAKREYFHVLQSYNRPDNVQLTFVNCAHTLGALKEFHQARKLLIMAIKYEPMPYSWMKLGEIYYKEKDLLSAEECFLEANSLDNRNGEVWGFLTLINIELGRKNEAELCHREAVKNNFKDTMILKIIRSSLAAMKRGK